MVSQERFGLKELNSVVIRAYDNMTIGNKRFRKGEPILFFEKIQIAEMNDKGHNIFARGGWGNYGLVVWDQPEDVTFVFKEGVLSRSSLSILSNAGLYTHLTDGTNLIVSKQEKLFVQNNTVTLLNAPIENSLFIYKLDNEGYISEDITSFSIDNKKLIFSNIPNNTEIMIDYKYNFNNGFTQYTIGDKRIDGYLSLEAKAYMKSEDDGVNRTFLLEMPRIKITSNLEMRIGEKASPTVSVFKIVGIPIKENGHFTVCKMNLLEEDIDSDI